MAYDAHRYAYIWHGFIGAAIENVAKWVTIYSTHRVHARIYIVGSIANYR